MGHLIDLGRLPVKWGLDPVACHHCTITRRLLAFRGRPETIGCSIGAIIRGPPTITRDSQHLLFRHRAGRSVHTITRLRAPLPPVSYLIARHGYTSALLSREIPCSRRIQTSPSLPDYDQRNALAASNFAPFATATGIERIVYQIGEPIEET